MARHIVILISVLVLAGPLRAEDITGQVRFLGKLPPPQKFTLTDGGTLVHHDLVVGKEKGLRDVVVLLENAPAAPKLAQAKPVLMDQKDMVFVPRVIAVQHGRPVQFSNSDLYNHSVMTASTIPENELNTFITPGKPYEHTFVTQKHPIQVGCSLHPWMRAWIFVCSHPHFAVSDEQGRFRIPDVPSGRYSVWFRHPDTGMQERRTVDVRNGRRTETVVDWRELPTK